MELATYLNFRGQCEEAFHVYETTLGARVRSMFRYRGSPFATDVPADWQEKVMHATLVIGDQVVMAADVAPERYEQPKGVSLSLQMKDPSEAERVFAELANDGQILMVLEKTFWAARFGVVVDRFGIPWMINCEG